MPTVLRFHQRQFNGSSNNRAERGHQGSRLQASSPPRCLAVMPTMLAVDTVSSTAGERLSVSPSADDLGSTSNPQPVQQIGTSTGNSLKSVTVIPAQAVSRVSSRSVVEGLQDLSKRTMSLSKVPAKLGRVHSIHRSSIATQNVSEDDKAKLLEELEKMDANGDGHISYDEVADFISEKIKHEKEASMHERRADFFKSALIVAFLCILFMLGGNAGLTTAVVMATRELTESDGTLKDRNGNIVSTGVVHEVLSAPADNMTFQRLAIDSDALRLRPDAVAGASRAASNSHPLPSPSSVVASAKLAQGHFPSTRHSPKPVLISLPRCATSPPRCATSPPLCFLCFGPPRCTPPRPPAARPRAHCVRNPRALGAPAIATARRSHVCPPARRAPHARQRPHLRCSAPLPPSPLAALRGPPVHVRPWMLWITSTRMPLRALRSRPQRRWSDRVLTD